MSADNWAICPRCRDKAMEAYKVALDEVGALYGKVPVEEFDEKRTSLKPPNLEDLRTFREDYEFYGAEQGEVNADYSGSCSVCGLHCELKSSRRFYPDV